MARPDLGLRKTDHPAAAGWRAGRRLLSWYGPEAKDGGIVPNRWIQALVGDDPSVFLAILAVRAMPPTGSRAIWPVWTNFFASLVPER
jgi:hypothetical protein